MSCSADGRLCSRWVLKTGMKEDLGEARETREAEVAGKVVWVCKVVVASGEWAAVGHFCQDVDEVVQP